MNFSDWNVGKCNLCNRTRYYYGSKEDYEPDDFKCECGSDIKFVDRDSWSAKDYSVIFGNDLEDRNHHWLTDMPNKLLNILRSANLSDEQQMVIMKDFYTGFFSR